jgi:hypothetical protein
MLMNLLRKHWPGAAGVALYWALTGAACWRAVRAAGGHWAYPLDDTYIHMAVAKHFAQDGVWGLTAAAGSSTSSPLWTFLLSGLFKLFGVREALPLILAALFGTALVWAGYTWLRRQVTSPGAIFAWLGLALAAAPLPALTLTGMEHGLHALLTLGLLAGASRILADPASSGRASVGLLCLAPFLILTRYEGLFLLLLLCALFLAHKKNALSLGLALLGLLPMAAYGWWSVSRGWFFLPSAVLLKGNFPAPTWLGYAQALAGLAAWKRLWASPALGLLFAGLGMGVLALRAGNRRWTETQWFAVMLMGLLLAHAQFAGLGWFYRYEAYLVFTGVLGAGALLAACLPGEKFWLGLRTHLPAGVLALLLAASLLAPFAARGARAWRDAPRASANIYRQQVQMGIFLRDYYAGQPVVVNDCGAVSFLSEAKITDIWGIGSREAAALKWEHRYSAQAVGALAQAAQAQVALVYEPWLRENGGVPAGWEKIETWTIPDNVVCGDATVSIYSLNPVFRESLRGRLRAFSPRLPAEVKQTESAVF